MQTYRYKLVETRTAYVEVTAENEADAYQMALLAGNGGTMKGVTNPEWDNNELKEVELL
jgi:hypothetical protein